jgi:hypothetical protein
MDLLSIAFMSSLLLLAAVAWTRGIPRATVSLQNLGLGIALLVALRVAGAVIPNRLTAFLAGNAPLTMVIVDWSLDPVVDLVSPALLDGRLLAADRWLFGETPSVRLEPLLTPWFTEALLIGYLSYFTLIALPLLLIWVLRGEESHDEYARAMTLLFVVNLGFYVLVPAVGPRFQVAEAYAAPLRGVLFGDRIRDLFLHVPFFRDCFPSGHTAGTLLALIYSRRRAPVFFWLALPLGALCISATVLCRFHYGVDLLCALPLTWFAVQGSKALKPEFWPGFAGLRAAAD